MKKDLDYRFHESVERNFDPNVKKAKRKYALTKSEREMILLEVKHKCKDSWINLMRKSNSVASYEETGDLEQEFEIFILKILDAYDKHRAKFVDINCKPLATTISLSENFYRYFYGRARLTGTNSMGKRKRRKEEIYLNSHVENDMSVGFVDKANTPSTIDAKIDLAKFISSLPSEYQELLNDIYVNNETQKSLQQKYGKDLEFKTKNLQRKINNFKHKVRG